MSYIELKDKAGYIHRKWRNKFQHLHREDGPAYIQYGPGYTVILESFSINGVSHRDSGPAYIRYKPDGSIDLEFFYVSGEFLGDGKKGFWALWERLDEEGRQAPDILKCLARYS